MNQESTNLALGEEVLASPIYFASIKERFCLNPNSDRKTYHIVLDLEESHCPYSVGDCIGVFPKNDPLIVNKILEALRVSSKKEVKNRAKQLLPLDSFLSTQVNLSRIPKKLGGHQLLDFLKSTTLSLQEICDHFLPMLPRYYSIASCRHVEKGQVHLTVGLTEKEEEEAVFPYGTCSYFLCCGALVGTKCIPFFHKPAPHFTLPDSSNEVPLIMIGPGTGVAPFRGFMQERVFRKASSENWLFFGEKQRKHDFYYEEYWNSLESVGVLKLSVAFSRDQEEKIYVQHRMLEHSALLWNWIQKGAYLYVCGDAKNMAKDVESTLIEIAKREGKLEEKLAKEYIRGLRKQGRYQRDVY